MANDRVDKSWTKSGLADYSDAAIFGTLAHYGVEVDEKGFRSLAQTRYPLGIAEVWLSQWRGTGQFAHFPSAAAAELWRRHEKGRPMPLELSEVLAGLVSGLLRKDPADTAPLFAQVAALKEKLPRKDGAVDEAFVEEAFAPFEEDFLRAFDELAEQLAKQGRAEEAQAFAELEELLLPDRVGVSTSVVRAVRGEREPAVAQLVQLAAEPARRLTARLMAVDALIHLEAFEESKQKGLALLDEAEKAQDYHAALALCGRLFHVFEQTEDDVAAAELEPRARRLSDAHDEAHPDHAHGHE